MASPAARASLKVAALCVLLLCVSSDLLARPALASSRNNEEKAAAGALLRELAEELGLGGGVRVVGDVCKTDACQQCLIVCAISCVLIPNPNPAACFANCTLASGCFSKPLLVA